MEMEKEKSEEMMELLINHRGEDFRVVVNMEMANTLLNGEYLIVNGSKL